MFSHFLLKGLTEGKADTNTHDGIIRVNELFDYIKENVINYTSNIQIPQINDEGYKSNTPILIYE